MDVNVRFRVAHPEDRADVDMTAKVCGRFVRTYFGLRNLDALWAKGHVHVAVAASYEDAVVGFAVAPHLVRKPWTSVYEIGVHPDYQRHGVGAAFIAYLCRSSPWGTIRLVCDGRNDKALAFYDRLGFRPLGIRHNRAGEAIHDLELTCGS